MSDNYKEEGFKHLDLFSGIGGFALAARWAGWDTVQFVEKDKYCQKILSKNFPQVPIHEDIKTFDAATLRGTIDIITGGFPCQPYSVAGKRKGDKDDRHLWPEMLRVIREVQPPWIVGENVYGFVNWSRGMVFDQVCADLEDEGYEVAPVILPACAINAPHQRNRIWIIAYSESIRMEGYRSDREQVTQPPIKTELPRCYSPGNYWAEWPTKSGVLRRDDGVPSWVERVKGLGNAIVPQEAYEIFKIVNKIKSL